MRHLVVLDAKTLQELTSVGDADLFAVGIAKAIADCLPLPSSPVEDASSSYFQEFMEPMADRCISFFNSARTFDVEHCKACVQAFWVGRYRTLYPMIHANVVVTPILSEAHFFGYGYHIPKVLLDYCKANAPALTNLANKAAKVVFNRCLITG